MQDFRFGIDAFDATDLFEIAGGGLFQRGVAVIGIATIFGFTGLGAERFNDFGKCHFVGFTDAEIDDFAAGMIRHGSAFGSFDFFKFVNGLGFAVLLSANARRKKILDVGFGHIANKARSDE